MNGDAEKDALRVLAAQGELLNSSLGKANSAALKAERAISDAEALLGKLRKPLPERIRSKLTPFAAESPRLRSWAEIVDEARNEQQGEFCFADIVSPDEMAAANSNFSRWNSEFAGFHRLTCHDYAAAGAAGILAGLVGIILVQVPKHPGFLGGPAAEGGWLSNVIKQQFGDLLPAGTIRALERNYPVPFDPSTSHGLAIPIATYSSDELIGARSASWVGVRGPRRSYGRLHRHRLGWP